MRRWKNLEFEDRVAEASLFFICALRSLPRNSGQFFGSYTEQLVPYMNKKNREYPSRFYGAKSLDELTLAHDHGSERSRYDFLVGSELDYSAVEVKLFLESLPRQNSLMILELMSGNLSKTKIAEKYGVSVSAMNNMLYKTGMLYQSNNWQQYDNRIT